MFRWSGTKISDVFQVVFLGSGLASPFFSFVVHRCSLFSLIFFDFLSLPQRGVDANGSAIPRTLEEETVFNTCLPRMGALYSFYPVLVLVDVPNGDTEHSYTES